MYLRFNGYRVINKGKYIEGGEFISYGYICSKTTNKETDKHVSVYFIPDEGYFYK